MALEGGAQAPQKFQNLLLVTVLHMQIKPEKFSRTYLLLWGHAPQILKKLPHSLNVTTKLWSILNPVMKKGQTNLWWVSYVFYILIIFEVLVLSHMLIEKYLLKWNLSWFQNTIVILPYSDQTCRVYIYYVHVYKYIEW